jgi:ribonucleotide reductase alpha subunit
MKDYSRMCDPPDNKDRRVMGGNPCLEQSLEHMEMCCLVESFFNRADSKEDFLRTLKFAYLYAKTVTLVNTHCAETNRVQLRNRRIGCSVTGVAQFLSKNNLHTLNDWLKDGYTTVQKWDTIYSEWFCIPKSIKMTSVKPSGTVSLLAGATPGMHFPESRFYIRRMRLANNSPLVQPLKDAGYFIEPCVGSETTTVVVEIPIDVGEGIRTVNDVSMWEQLSLAANMQRWWADNQVSCTITFNPETEGKHIASALDYFQYQLKGVSFLPKCNFGAYPQMPYEEITEEVYNEKCQSLGKLVINKMSEDSIGEKFCDGDSCVRI